MPSGVAIERATGAREYRGKLGDADEGNIDLSTGGSTGTTPSFGGFGGSGCNGSTDDQDGDGYTIEMGDCNDCDPNVNPGAIEVVAADGHDSSHHFDQVRVRPDDLVDPFRHLTVPVTNREQETSTPGTADARPEHRVCVVAKIHGVQDPVTALVMVGNRHHDRLGGQRLAGRIAVGTGCALRCRRQPGARRGEEGERKSDGEPTQSGRIGQSMSTHCHCHEEYQICRWARCLHGRLP